MTLMEYYLQLDDLADQRRTAIRSAQDLDSDGEFDSAAILIRAIEEMIDIKIKAAKEQP